MTTHSNQTDKGFVPGERISGFRVTKIEKIEETDSWYQELEHEVTGARHIHIACDDKENTFGVVLKTVPRDSTGVAHILEHTVLCGSEKFPVRDPFFSMLKRSLSTFMNAFTSSDWTMYPFSTENRQDFYNLLDVYLDAVFFPHIEELSFRQEGFRLEVEGNPEIPDQYNLVYKGVVFNEMKGVMSSPDQVMSRSLLKELYPFTTYHYNSGGDPESIPKLTYAQLKDFHKQHYHPSNSYFYTYGNLPLGDHLEFIQDKVLRKFKRIDPDTDVSLQPRWESPKKAVYYYPLAENEDPAKKYQACVAWLTADIKDNFEILVLALLEQILLGNPAAPLRKALIDSGLGSDLCDTAGFNADNRDTMFACGLKDIEESSAEKIVTITFAVLKDLAENGIDQTLIDSAIHQIEFNRKEVTNTPYPYGLKQLLLITGAWLHHGDPLRKLQIESDLVKLRRSISKGKFFEDRIKKYFIDNSHRILFVLAPDQLLDKKERDREADALVKVKSGLKKPILDKIVQQAKALEKLQETKEDISCLPTLKRKDIPSQVPVIKPSDDIGVPNTTCYKQPTSGILYFTGVMGAGEIEQKLLPLVPFYCHAFTKMGTDKRDYVELARKIDLYTGGVGLAAHSRTGFHRESSCIPFITVNGKCLSRNRDHMMEIIGELLFHYDFSDLDRLKSLLLEYHTGLVSMIVSNGHRFAISLAARNFTSARSLGELWSGVSQVKTIKEIVTDLTDEKLIRMASDLNDISKILLKSENFKTALVGEEGDIKGTIDFMGRKDPLSTLIQSPGPEYFKPPKININDEMVYEGWSTSSSVSFNAKAFETVRLKHEDSPVLSVISRLIRSMFLHREIREKGGAYGGFSLYNTEDGIFCYASYRDPHIVSTLDVFSRVADFIRSGEFTGEDVDEAILQVCSDVYKPDSPGTAAQRAFYRRIIFLSDETRKEFKKRLLKVTREQVLKTANKYFDPDRMKCSTAVISGNDLLKAANSKLDHPLVLREI